MLNRPEKLNAISAEAMEMIDRGLARLADDPDIACLVVRGVGRSFSAGFDLETLPDDPAVFQAMARTIDAMESFPRPTIAQIHGHCLTGALELALACDLRVAADDAVFADTHGRFGLVPVCGMSVRLPERIGSSRAKLMGFTGRHVCARQAESWGLVDLAVPPALLGATVLEITDQIRGNSADANRILKALVVRGSTGEVGREQALADERELRLGIPKDRDERLSAAARR